MSPSRWTPSHISTSTAIRHLRYCSKAQKRGHSISYYTPDKLSLRGEELVAPVQLLTVRDEVGDRLALQ